MSVLPHGLHLAHTQNDSGSWLFAFFGFGSALKPIVVLICIATLCVAPFVYRFYVRNHRRFYWPSVAYGCLLAGMLSYSIDMATRGVVIDYIRVPGVVVVDLKDILLSFGIAAFLIEAIENPAISLRWKGWRAEYRDARELVTGFMRFAAGGERQD